MSKSPLSKPLVRESVGRNSFDRSFIVNNHCSHGMLLPIMMEPCVAGTKGVINRKNFCRTADIVAPAFNEVTQHFDFFKVPIRLLWSQWNTWKTNIDDVNSSSLSQVYPAGASIGQPNIPRMNFGYDTVTSTSFFDNLKTTLMTNLAMQVTSAAQFSNDMLRLCEALGYGTDWSRSTANVKNLLPAAAYQKVYYDFYRNTNYEPNNPFAYNLDWLTMYNNINNGLLNPVSSSHDSNVFKNLFSLRYVNYRNDYFRNVYPSVSYAANLNSFNPPDIPNVKPNSVYFEPRASSTVDGLAILHKTGVQGLATLGITVPAIRAAFALDKLMRAAAYAPKHVKDQFKARFGVDVGDKVSNESERIGSFVDQVVFGEVTNQADTKSSSTGSYLGALGGKGVGATRGDDKDLHFYCEEDSIIIGVTYFLTRAIYDCVEDEWNNKLVREDFFQPEFQNLGLRVVTDPFGLIQGYTTPNLRYKIGRDMNFGCFKTSYSLVNTSSSTITYSSSGTNVLRTFTVHSAPPSSAGGLNYLYFKALPSHLDYIYRSNYSSTGQVNTDQFYFNLRVKFATVQPMSVHGQPLF